MFNIHYINPKIYLIKIKISEILYFSSNNCYFMLDIEPNGSDCPHFFTNFDFTIKLFWVEYLGLAIIKVLYQRSFTKMSQSFELFYIKCMEGHSPWGGVTVCSKWSAPPRSWIIAPGVTGCLWIIVPGVTRCAEMFQILVQNEYTIKFTVVVWVYNIYSGNAGM